MTKTKETSSSNMYVRNRKIFQPVIGITMILAWIMISTLAFTGLGNETALMANSLLGLGIGYILQRSFFGFAGTVVRTSKGSPKLAYAVMLLFGIGAIFVAIMVKGKFPTAGILHNRPISLGTVLGAAIFGMGMVLAKACASGILTDMSKGTVFVVIVVVFFIIGAGPGQMIQDTMNNVHGKSGLGIKGIGLTKELGVAGALVITLLVLIFVALGAHIIAKKVRENNNLNLDKIELYMDEKDDIFKEWLKANSWEFVESPKLFSKAWFKVLYFHVFAKKWNLFLGAVILFLALAGVMMINGKGWGVTTSFARMFHWIFQVDVFNGATSHGGVLKDSQGILDDPGTFRNAGLVVGAIAYMLMANKFRFTRTFKGLNKVQIITTILVAAVAGFMLGFGARVADGCNAGQLATGVMTFSLSSWLFAVGMVLGGVGGIFAMKLISKKTGI